MSYAGPSIRDITRVVGDRFPPETYTYPADLTGHTVHLVIEDADGAVVSSIEGVVVPAATSGITFTLDAGSVAATLVGSYSVIVDKDSPTLRQTIEGGDWTVVDYAG